MDTGVAEALAQDLRILGERWRRIGAEPGARHLVDRARTISSEIAALLADLPGPANPDEAAPAGSLPPLRVTNLGRFRIRRGDDELPPCRSRRGVALFRFLLTRRDRGAHKDELTAVFWADAGPREAAHSLHVAVSALRAALDPPHDDRSYLAFEGGYYRISPEAVVEDDAAAFQRLAAEADAASDLGWRERAAAGYESDLRAYGGDYDTGDPPLPWGEAERERLLLRYLAVLERLGAIRFAQGQFDLAIECYRAVLGRDGYREDAHGQLMRCYWHLGRRREAILQYATCARLLQGDLGIDPMPALQVLLARITTEPGPPLPGQPDPPSPVAVAGPVRAIRRQERRPQPRGAGEVGDTAVGNGSPSDRLAHQRPPGASTSARHSSTTRSASVADSRRRG